MILSREAEKMVPASDVAEELRESPAYVAKILQELVRHGILGSRRGANGGFYLNRPPSDVTLWDLVMPFEADLDEKHCMIDGGTVCDDGNVCGMHPYWARINREIMQTLKETSLFELWRHSSRNPDADESVLSPEELGCDESTQGAAP